MPELPEVETVRRGLAPVLVGARIERAQVRRPDLRFPFPERFAERLQGRRVERLDRRAKYLLAHLDGGEVLVMHLGMSGSFRVARGASEAAPGAFHHARGAPGAHDHVVLQLSNGARVTYNDPRRFGFMTLVAEEAIGVHPFFRDLGLEPLGEGLTPDALAARLEGRRVPLKTALLDQRIIAGLGNIYVSEALFRAHLSPRRLARTLVTHEGRPTARLTGLVAAIRAVLEEAILAGGSTLKDHVQANGEIGAFQNAFRVYERAGAPCVTPECGGTVQRLVQSGRSSFYCPRCQR